MRSITLAIPHTPHVPARVESYQRLLELIGMRQAPLGNPTHEAAFRLNAEHGHSAFRCFEEKAPNWAWSSMLWTWGLETGADYLLQLQDDVDVVPNFWPALRAMLEAVPDQVIGLEAAHPEGKRLALEGHRWCTTSDYLVGPGYVLPRALLEEFLRWRRDALRPKAVEEISEDSLIGLWCWCTARHVWHPIPTIIDHDTSIESTYSNEAHSCRKPSVTWKDCDVLDLNPARLEDVDFWRVAPQHPVHLGRVYNATPWTARMWLRDSAKVPDYADDDAATERYRAWL